MMTKLLHYVSFEVRNLPHYDGLINVDFFLDAFEREVVEKHRFQALNWVLNATPTRWWGTQNDSFSDWRDYRRRMRIHFGSQKSR